MLVRIKKSIPTFAIGLVGALVGNILFASLPLHAAKSKDQQSSYELVNAKGQRVGTYAVGDGDQGVLFLFSDKGKTTVQLGSYPNTSEKGQALIGMSDPFDQLRMLMRLHGPENSPTVILKDRYGTDKIVFGLRGENQTPYFEYVLDDGRTMNLLKTQ